MRFIELTEREGCRAHTARDVARILHEHWNQPDAPNPLTCELFAISSRHNMYVVDQSEATEEDTTNTHTIITKYRDDQWDAKTIAGIMSIYMIRADKPKDGETERYVHFKNYTCFCDDCRNDRRSSQCKNKHITGEWIRRKVIPVNVGAVAGAVAGGVAEEAVNQADGGDGEGGEDDDDRAELGGTAEDLLAAHQQEQRALGGEDLEVEVDYGVDDDAELEEMIGVKYCRCGDMTDDDERDCVCCDHCSRWWHAKCTEPVYKMGKKSQKVDYFCQECR
jgi:hypothetical protein